jgi:hypothetical protein
MHLMFLHLARNPYEEMNSCLLFRVVETFGYVHLSAGDLLRAERCAPGSQVRIAIAERCAPGSQVRIATAERCAPGSQVRIATAERCAPGSQVRIATAERCA